MSAVRANGWQEQPTVFRVNLKRGESGRRTIVKRLMINVVMVAVGLGVSLASRTSEAAEQDVRVGSFEGNWCGFAARFDIQKRVGDTWDFEGKILIKATGQY